MVEIIGQWHVTFTDGFLFSQTPQFWTLLTSLICDLGILRQQD